MNGDLEAIVLPWGGFQIPNNDKNGFGCPTVFALM
jgi:hypothetical protein